MFAELNINSLNSVDFVVVSSSSASHSTAANTTVQSRARTRRSHFNVRLMNDQWKNAMSRKESRIFVCTNLCIVVVRCGVELLCYAVH